MAEDEPAMLSGVSSPCGITHSTRQQRSVPCALLSSSRSSSTEQKDPVETQGLSVCSSPGVYRANTSYLLPRSPAASCLPPPLWVSSTRGQGRRRGTPPSSHTPALQSFPRFGKGERNSLPSLEDLIITFKSRMRVLQAANTDGDHKNSLISASI